MFNPDDYNSVVVAVIDKAYLKKHSSDHVMRLRAEAIHEISESIRKDEGFVKAWVSLFVVFSDERAKPVMQDIFKQLDLEIPLKHREIVNV